MSNTNGEIIATLQLSLTEITLLDFALASKIKEGHAYIAEGFDVQQDVDNLEALQQKVKQLIIGEK